MVISVIIYLTKYKISIKTLVLRIVKFEKNHYEKTPQSYSLLETSFWQNYSKTFFLVTTHSVLKLCSLGQLLVTL